MNNMQPEFSDFNKKQYEENATQYLESNADGGIGGNSPEQRAGFLATVLPKDRSVFEIGSGGGLDAQALEKAGYKVTASDYVQAFVDVLASNGLNAIQYDAKKDQLPTQFDAVYANAVFVHFSPEEITSFLTRVNPQLTGEKIIFLSIIKGEGAERSGRNRGFDRDFNYYQLNNITQIAEAAGYSVVKSHDVNEKWLQVLLQAK